MNSTRQQSSMFLKVTIVVSTLFVFNSHWVNADWQSETVSNNGSAFNLALDSIGNPHVCYPGIMPVSPPIYASKSGSNWNYETVNNIADWINCTLDLDSEDNPHICCYDNINHGLIYATKIGSSWVNEPVDNADSAGGNPSLVLDSNDNPHCVYLDFANFDLKYAYKIGSSWVIETVDGGLVVSTPSLALDSLDQPHVSYQESTSFKYASKIGNNWLIETVDPSSNMVSLCSLALDSLDKPHISYDNNTDHSIKYAYKTGNSWLIETVDPSASFGYNRSLALDNLNKPHIISTDLTDTYIIQYSSKTGGRWVTETVVRSGCGFLTPLSLAIDSTGIPHISYSECSINGSVINYNVKYARAPVADPDHDGVFGYMDNCFNIANGPQLGTCISGSIGAACMSNAACGTSGVCSMNQEDTCPPSGNICGDACECEGNFDGDQDQDGTDAFIFKQDFGRSSLQRPCTTSDPCNGDFLCDEDVDGTDASKFKQDFGRSALLNSCPNFETVPWCVYP